MNSDQTQKYIDAAQKFLEKHDMPKIPEQYCLLLKKMNGFTTAGLCLFGVGPETTHKHNQDIALYNLNLNMRHKETALVLGCTPFDWIVFEQKEQTYNLIDKTDGLKISTFNSLTDLLKYLQFYKND